MSADDRRLLYQSIPDSDDEADDPDAIVAYSSRSKKPSCFCVLCVLLLILLFLAVIILTVLLLVVGHQPPRVETTCGIVQGRFDAFAKVYDFKGIPFAQPPVSKRRWQPPVPLSKTNRTCWKGIYKANSAKSHCAQWDGTSNKTIGSEDCLYLNIYSPSVEPLDAPLPVMVYIHGGGLRTGGADTPGFSPTPDLAYKLNVVFVSIQYRLSALGFLVIDQLSGNGNYGYQDQIQALKWVRDNIKSFGGNPSNVTLFGHSSGGTSAWSLMMSPKARGLFQRVWTLSQSTIFDKTITEAKKDNAFFVNQTSIRKHCPDVDEACLRTVSVSDILVAVQGLVHDGMDLPTRGQFIKALPVIDGDVFPDSPVNLLARKATHLYSDVPVIFGSTAEEVDYAPAPYFKDSTFDKWDKSKYYKYLASHLDPFGKAGNHSLSITNVTMTMYPYVKTALTFAKTVTDIRATCGISDIARKTAEAFDSAVYRYVITARPSQPVTGLTAWPARYAFHGFDISAFFEGFDVLFNFKGRVSEQDTAFATNLQEEVMSFVASGKVKSVGWKRYPNATARISQDTTIIKEYKPARCDFWRKNGFLNYSWIN